MSRELYVATCSVCGEELMYATSTNVAQSTGFCLDTLCRFYPTSTTSRSEDPTLSGYVASLVECTDVPAVQISRLMDLNPSRAGYITAQQLKRWERVA